MTEGTKGLTKREIASLKQDRTLKEFLAKLPKDNTTKEHE